MTYWLDLRFGWLLSTLLIAGCCCCGGTTSVNTDGGSDEWVATGDADGPTNGDDSADDGAGDGAMPPVEAAPVAGGELNKYFPDSEGDFILIYQQEKQGFAQASLSRDGVEVATLSISDTRSNPEAAEKYAGATDEIAGYPATAMGSNALGVLVGDRFQVSARSIDESFSEADRRAWLGKFRLNELSQLK